jgi:drug/metabolite transporter, DME family
MRTLRSISMTRVPGVVLVSLAASLWGLDALIRKPLVGSNPPATIVFGEHVVLVAITLPLLWPALRALFGAGAAYVLAGIAVGAGASAVATVLFTEAFVSGDYITPLVLQKAQPLVAVLGAAIVLGERPRPRFAWFLLPALAGIWLISIRQPLDPQARGLRPVLYALGAAALWGLGTVFGRFLTRKLRFEHVTTVRFFFGLIGSAVAVWVLGAAWWTGVHNASWIAVLALVTGAIALPLYYYGLQRTPAMTAALGELSFVVTATLIGLYVQNPHLRWTQWSGIAVTTAVVTLLPVRRREIVRVPDQRLASAPAAG